MDWTADSVVDYWRKQLHLCRAERRGGFWYVQRPKATVRIQLATLKAGGPSLTMVATANRSNTWGNSTLSTTTYYKWLAFLGKHPIVPDLMIRRTVEELEDSARWVTSGGPIAEPEPLPRAEGEPIPELLVEWLEEKIENSGTVISDVQARAEFGFKKYGQYLMSDDGRDTINDARQEAIDLLKYMFKARVRGEDLTELKDVLAAIVTLYKDTNQ
jgi:hypothetical protein